MVVNPLADSQGRAFGGVWGKAPHITTKRSAKGELKNSPVDCFLRGNALQGRAFPDKSCQNVGFAVYCVDIKGDIVSYSV